MKSLFDCAYEVLMEKDPAAKCKKTREYQEAWLSAQLSHVSPQDKGPARTIETPGLPDKLRLVQPRFLKQRSIQTTQGRIALYHAIAHIEFNAINLAWDAVYRFRDMPEDFYTDWIRVATEEAKHFSMLRAYLNEMNADYGDLPAHNGLWETAVQTSQDVMLRMALVPRVLEARGLDVTPGISKKLKEAGDQRGVDILQVIYEEEIGHVETGTRWFRYLTQQRQLPADETFSELVNNYMLGRIRGPFDEIGRNLAGFSETEMNALKKLEKIGLGNGY